MSIRPVVIAPTYNNADTVEGVIREILQLGLPIIVINDGCTDNTPARLAMLSMEHAQGPFRAQVFRILAHDRNRGKAAALMTGFREAMTDGMFTHAVTIDTDGQLNPIEVKALIRRAESDPHSLIVGVRDFCTPDYPAKNKVGRRLSNLAIRIESGARVTDSQCGFRVYPLELIRETACRTGHFSFEAEIITRAVWAGFDISEVPVTCRYLPAGQRVSHFKPWRDTMRGLCLHGTLMVEAFWRRPLGAWMRVRGLSSRPRTKSAAC